MIDLKESDLIFHPLDARVSGECALNSAAALPKLRGYQGEGEGLTPPFAARNPRGSGLEVTTYSARALNPRQKQKGTLIEGPNGPTHCFEVNVAFCILSSHVL